MSTQHNNNRQSNSPSIPSLLSAAHREMLYTESAIAPDVVAERGVCSTRGGRYLPEEFSPRQRRRGGGVLFTLHRPNGETSFSFRPDRVDPQKPGHKYEQPCKQYGGPGNVLDVHPSSRHLIDRLDVPVIFVEGIKKADAITSAARASGVEILVVAISGVWNWRTRNEDNESVPVLDLDKIPLEGRKVIVCFDSDILTNPDVQNAARALGEHLESLGSKVFVTFFPEKPAGEKVGADDFLAAGGTLSEMRLLSRPFNPEDFTLVRLTRDERLRLAVEDLLDTLWFTPWKRVQGREYQLTCSTRDVFIVIMERAARHGYLIDDGVRAEISQRTIELEARASSRTVWKALDALEASGLGYRPDGYHKRDKQGAFVLRAKVRQYGTREGQEEKATQTLQSLYQPALLSRGEFLRWSSPGRRAKRGTVKDTSKVRQGPPAPSRETIRRAGKSRAADRDALVKLGGERGWVDADEIAELRGKRSGRELIRRKRTPKGRDGSFIMLEAFGLVEIDDERGAVRLTENWREAEHKMRKETGELEADAKQRGKVQDEREEYRAWVKAGRPKRQVAHEPEQAPTVSEMDAARAARTPDFFAEKRPESKPVSLLAAVLHEYLYYDAPQDVMQFPGWLAGTLWALERCPTKPTASDVSAALEELGGEAFRRECLERSHEHKREAS